MIHKIYLTPKKCATNQISCIISFFAFEAFIRKVYCIPLFALRKIMVSLVSVAWTGLSGFDIVFCFENMQILLRSVTGFALCIFRKWLIQEILSGRTP